MRKDQTRMDADPPLLVERVGAVARLVLNRPSHGNAIDLQTARTLYDAATEVSEHTTIRCVVLTGRGALFCGGGDIDALAAAGDNVSSLLKDLTTTLHAAMSLLARMDKPLVTAINGSAAGAGFGLAMLGDLAIAARSARFSLSYGGIGLSPDAGATWLLPRLVGLRRAQELMLTDARVDAEKAASMGLVTRVVADADLFAASAEFGEHLSVGPVRAFGRTRNLLLSSFSTTFESQMEQEAQAIAVSGRDIEGREGVSAHMARREPRRAL